jgi:hypothetical protein
MLVDPGRYLESRQIKDLAARRDGLKCAYRKFYLKSTYYE